MIPVLSLLETRVLGVLVEKERTVPDTYPLTLNALVAGCNQKTSRAPIMSASESEVHAAIDRLRSMNLVIETSGGRVPRYTHNVERVLHVPKQSSALIAVLMLRGPQTPGELRISSERLHSFADLSSVEAFLRELAERPAGALVAELPRQSGTRERRWAHLLSGSPPPQDNAAGRAAADGGNGGDVPISEIAAMKAQISRLEDEVNELKSLAARICAGLGIER